VRHCQRGSPERSSGSCYQAVITQSEFFRGWKGKIKMNIAIDYDSILKDSIMYVLRNHGITNFYGILYAPKEIVKSVNIMEKQMNRAIAIRDSIKNFVIKYRINVEIDLLNTMIEEVISREAESINEKRRSGKDVCGG